MDKSKLLELLYSEIVSVEFIKKDGTLREVTCTLRSSSLPKQLDVEEYVQKRAPNPEVLSVFETYLQDWRSFRFDSIQRVNGVPYIHE